MIVAGLEAIEADLRDAVALLDPISVEALDGDVRQLVAAAAARPDGVSLPVLERLCALYAEMTAAVEVRRSQLAREIAAERGRQRAVAVYFAAGADWMG